MAKRHDTAVIRKVTYLESRVFKILAKIVSAVLILGGIGAFAGGQYAGSFIAEQLGAQDITMPTTEALDKQAESGRISAEDADALRPYAGQKMTTGAQAKVFADNYIAAHMRAAAKGAGVPDATFATVGNMFNEKKKALTEELAAANPGAEKEKLAAMAEAEIANPLTTYEAAKEAKKLESLRFDTFLNGNTLRGMLLNAYGWGLIGAIAWWAGIALIVAGVALCAYGFIPAKKNA